MFHRHQDRPAPFTAEGETLDHAQNHQHDRREDADLIVGRQQADGKSRDAHRHQREDQHRLAANAVAEVTADHPAQRSHDGADREGRKRQQRTHHRIVRRKEQLAEHDRRGRRVDVKIVEFDARPDQAGKRGSPGDVG